MKASKINQVLLGLIAASFSLMAVTDAGAQKIDLSPVLVNAKAVENGKDKLIQQSVRFLVDPAEAGLDAGRFQLEGDVKVTSLPLDQKTLWVGISSDAQGRKKYALQMEGADTQVKEGPATTWSRSFTSFNIPTGDGTTSLPLYMRATGNPPQALRYFVPVYYEGEWKPEGGEALKVAIYDAERWNSHTQLLLDLDNDVSYRFKSPTMEVRDADQPFKLYGKGYLPAADYDKKELVLAESNTDGPELAVLRFGALAPDWSATDFDGKPVKLSDFRGKFVFFDVWATWCGPCIGEIPHIQEAQEKYGDKVAIIGVSIDGDIDLPKKMVADKKLTYNQFWAPDEFQSVICQQYQVNGIPSTFLVDPEGKLVSSGLRGDAIGKSLEMASKFETPEAKLYFAESAERAEAFQKVENMVESGEKAQAVAMLKLLKEKHKDPEGLETLERYLKFLEKE